LLLTAGEAAVLRLTSAGVVLLAGLFGLTKVFLGVARDRPVGFLIALLILTLIVAVAFLGKRPFRSRRGDALLGRLRQDNAALEYAAGRSVHRLADSDLVLALGLFGLSALAAGPLRHAYTSLLAARLWARVPAWSSWRSPIVLSCGSSCASFSGSGGGGGCGGGGCGGGCGGGGCGGCGG